MNRPAVRYPPGSALAKATREGNDGVDLFSEEGLPEELRKELHPSGQRARGRASRLTIELLRAAPRGLTVDEVLIGYWRMHKEVVKRKTMIQRLLFLRRKKLLICQLGRWSVIDSREEP